MRRYQMWLLRTSRKSAARHVTDTAQGGPHACPAIVLLGLAGGKMASATIVGRDIPASHMHHAVIGIGAAAIEPERGVEQPAVEHDYGGDDQHARQWADIVAGVPAAVHPCLSGCRSDRLRGARGYL